MTGPTDPALRALREAISRLAVGDPDWPLHRVLALAAAAEAAPLDVERLRRAYLIVDKAWRAIEFHISGEFWPRVAREYAALRSPDTGLDYSKLWPNVSCDALAYNGAHRHRFWDGTLSDEFTGPHAASPDTETAGEAGDGL